MGFAAVEFAAFWPFQAKWLWENSDDVRCLFRHAKDSIMRIVLFIALSGALGCVARYLLSGWVNGFFGGAMLYGTFAVNVLGAFLIGLVMEFSLRGSLFSQELRIGLTAGFLGGFTTFSAFSYETFRLLEDGLLLQATLYVSASVVACLVFTFAGMIVCRSL